MAVGKWVAASRHAGATKNLALDREAGRAGLRRRDAPDATSCADHMGSNQGACTRDGKKWNFTSRRLQADEMILKPLVQDHAAKYAADKS
ncbi:hypothetical protein [Candidatus Skiveiella danica]|uniref:hypothetical protein n=1 Tax=Candidatus Skiveiella danica TaxID=3386177 RepID=UPI0039B9842B